MKTLRFLLLSLVLGSLTGCSVDMFSSKRADPNVGKTDYRKIQPECSGLKFDQPEFDGKTFRALVQCFNSNGSIPELAALVASASPRTLEHTASVINTGFLSDRQSLAQSRDIVRRVGSGEAWNSEVASFSYLLSGPERVSAAVRLFSVTDRETPLANAFSRMNPRETMRAFEILSRVSRSRAFQSLQKGILNDPLSPEDRSRLKDLLSNFISSQSSLHSARSLFSDMVAGKSSGLWTYVLGSETGRSDASVRSSVLRFRTFLDDAEGNGGATLRGLSRLHQGFHHPISCWGDGKVFDSPWKNLSEEFRLHSGDRLLPFMTRFTAVAAIGVRDLCEIPPEFLENYGVSQSLIVGRSGEAFVGLLDRVIQGGMAESTGYFVGEWGERLSDVLSILQAHPWFSDFILTIAELDASDRDALASWFSDFLDHIQDWETFARSWDRATVDATFSDLGTLLSGDAVDLGRVLDSIVSLFESSRAHPWLAGWKKILQLSSQDSLEPLTKLDGFPAAVLAMDQMARDGRLASMIASTLEILGGKAPAAADVNITEESLRKSLRHGLVSAELGPAVASVHFEGAGIEQGPRVDFDDSLRACARLDIRKRATEQWSDYALCTGASADPSLGASEQEFIGRFVRSWMSLPLSKESKKEVIALISGERGLPKVTVAGLRALIEPVHSWISSAWFELLSRMRTEASVDRSKWDAFFKGIGDLLRDPSFAPVANAIRRMENPDSAAGNHSIVMGSVDDAKILQSVRNFECISDAGAAHARMAEISGEFSNAVRWDRETLRTRAEAFASSLRSSALRAGLYRFLQKSDARLTVRWFLDRASDARPVALMDPKTRTLKVRWMTSLDRLESVLVNSNFHYVLPGNTGLRFISRFAEAWGDEPRESWPAKIQARYGGRRRPPTLGEVYAEVEDFVAWFERLGGLPKIPDCVQSMDRPWMSEPDAITPFDLKAKGFNLKQTLSVIRENLPGSGTANADGMRFLRDLFWAIESSGPDSLRTLQELGDLGGLRLLSRAFQSIRSTGELTAIEDAWTSVSTLSTEPAFDRLLVRVLDPAFLSSWIDHAESGDVKFDPFVVRIVSVLARDRSMGFLPALARIADRSMSVGMPSGLAMDLFDQVASGNSRLNTLRPASAGDARILRGARGLFERRIEGLFSALPTAQIVGLLEKDSALRTKLVELAKTDRQSSVEASSDGAAALDLFLSETHPEFRSLVGLWCGQEASGWVDEFATHPNESALMIDGLFQSASTSGMSDFLDALLRQLPH